MNVVLDASAILLWLHEEPGAEQVAEQVPNACISCVNWAEVIKTCLAKSVDVSGIRQDVAMLGLVVEPFTAIQAEIAAALWQRTRRLGLSFSRRACLALASEKSLPVLTADRQWRKLRTNAEISLVSEISLIR